MGQHPAIIGQDLWDRVQQRLSQNASRARRQETTSSPSPFAVTFTDEIGNLLTPSHAFKNGQRYRYYISRRLITQSGEETIGGWRLPARMLEDAVAEILRSRLGDPATAARLLLNASANDVAKLRTSLCGLVQELAGDQAGLVLTELVASGKIEPGRLSLVLDPNALATTLDVASERLDPDALQLSSGFELRRRGVEAKLILDVGAPQIDKTLLRNLAKAHAWLKEIKHGTTIRTIAEREGTTRSRVTAIIDLAFLAPDIVQSITEGRQPTERLIKTPTPILWSDQRTSLA
ncbi:MAG: hypothetical protein AAFN27_00495 [Pseudomonadota bacterium]